MPPRSIRGNMQGADAPSCAAPVIRVAHKIALSAIAHCSDTPARTLLYSPSWSANRRNIARKKIRMVGWSDSLLDRVGILLTRRKPNKIAPPSNNEVPSLAGWNCLKHCGRNQFAALTAAEESSTGWEAQIPSRM